MNHDFLIQLRKDLNATQDDVAKEVGIDRSYYSKIENGLKPSVKTAKSLGRVLGFEWTIFFEENCAKTKQTTA